ncbi:hypothetical protein JTB14_030648 [Gonioctena quinquepunctata]|nr:hypothetical protein JTB14_030648 [Gonioctena quinquepunctata]
MPYNEAVFTKKMEEYFYKGLHLTFCRKRDDSLVIKEDIVKLPEFQEYQNRENIQCSYRTKTPFTAASERSTAAKLFSQSGYLSFVILLVIIAR